MNRAVVGLRKLHKLIKLSPRMRTQVRLAAQVRSVLFNY